jgi:hypothetical protein
VIVKARGYWLSAVCVVVAGLVAGPGAGVAAGACSVSKSTAYDNPADGAGNTSVDSAQEVAQSFKVPSATTLNKVSLYLANIGSTTDAVTVEIRADAAGSPGAVMATRTRTLASTALAFADFDFSADNIALVAGTTYYIVATNTSASFDGYTWQSDGISATYPDGSFFFDHGSGTSWVNNTSYDQLFQVFGQTCVADQPAPDIVAPKVLKLGFTNKTFRAAAKGGSVARKARPVGTKVSYKLSEAASAKFTVERAAKGRKKGKKCVAPNSHNRRRKSCRRYKRLKGSFTRASTAGANSFRFTGRLRGKKLRPGSYRLVMVATDSAGNKSKPKRAQFRIVTS